MTLKSLEDNDKNLLQHFYWGHFDSGVLFIFLSLMIWEETENMLTLALAFSIPIVIDTVVDYFFSTLSDQHNRKKLMILGNFGSALALAFYGFAGNLYLLYGLIFIKSLFAKLYQSSLAPYIRENIREEDYMSFISQRNIKISLGASVGGFSLMIFYSFTQNLALVFLLSAFIELYSTFYLFKLKDEKVQQLKKKEDAVDLDWIRYITFIYTVESFAIAMIVNRILIYIHDFQGIAKENLGLVFFIVFGLSSFLAARIYPRFASLSLNKMWIFSFFVQAILLVSFTQIKQLSLLIALWFIYELAANISNIYTSHKINASLFTDIGKRLSRFRIMIALGSIFGQFILSSIWEYYGMNASFYFSAVLLLGLSLWIAVRKKMPNKRSFKISKAVKE